MEEGVPQERRGRMAEFESKYFGKISYGPEAVIEFPAGLPGFEQERRFLLIQQPVNRPLAFLQSLNRPELCFVTIPVRVAAPDYSIRLSAEEARLLGIEEGTEAGAGGELLCLGIVAVEEDGSATVNLRAPLVIHWARRLGVQAIPEECGYSHRHPLEAPQEAGCL